MEMTMIKGLDGQVQEGELPFVNSPSETETSTIDWSRIDVDSIGSNFEVLDDLDKPKRKVIRMSPRLAKFVIGASPHLFFVLSPKIPKYVVRKTQPINTATKVSESEKATWVTSLGKNMKSMSTFLERDLLPLTSALASATLNSQERYAQLIDDPEIKLPLGFILKKANLAAQLKIIDKISDFMSLSAENRRLMKSEFRLNRPDTPATPNERKNSGDT
jgi:hypothetical protein